DGSGSLRFAISRINAECIQRDTPCRVVFRFSAPATIKPATPLPTVTAYEIAIDGSGPLVTIDGSQTSGNGFVSLATIATIRHLTIKGFLNAIVVGNETRSFRQIDIDGNNITANERGIRFLGGDGIVRNNVITANTRSGLFVDDTVNLAVTNNHVLDNGASGMYFARFASGVTISDNEIARNHDFGIAIDPAASTVSVIGNSIHDDGIDAIDIGLDLPNANDSSSPRAQRPTIAAARFDATTNETVISLHLDTPPVLGKIFFKAHVYANHALNSRGIAEAEQYLGGLNVNGADTELRIAGDLRGRIITALLQRFTSFSDYYFIGTSELSDGVLVP